MSFKLVLVDLQQKLVDEWKITFQNFPDVEVVCGDFKDQEFDCIVSAANSFGLMDGGVDGAITDYFGLQMMERMQQMVVDNYGGEQPVNTSHLLVGNPGGDNIKYVAHTPTMRVPMDIGGTTNVYYAMKAMLYAVKNHNMEVDTARQGDPAKPPIRIVACPGLGTMAGRVPLDEAARQMAWAYQHFINPIKKIDWYVANVRHGEVLGATFHDPKKLD